MPTHHSATRLSVFAATALSTAVVVPLLPDVASAQNRAAQQTQPVVENSKFRFEGRINGNNVRVRSGPSENYYETDKLTANAPVVVVGNKFEWLKIIPPADSFSVVAKGSIDAGPDGRTGTVKTDNLSVRAGSKLNAMKVTVQCRLNKGDTVEIIGSQDEYYKIKPPAEAYLYVHQQFVTPIRQLDANSTVAAKAPERSTEPAVTSGASTTAQPATTGAEPIAATTDEADNTPAVTQDSLANSSRMERIAVAVPATQPVKPVEPTVNVGAEFDRLDAQWNSAQALGIEQFPASELLAGYEGLLAQSHLPISMHRVAQVRAASLRIKSRAKQEFLSTMQQQQEAMKKIEALREQRQIVEKRLEAGVTVYTAVGTLQPSTLQLGKKTLYRLTDPATGRSLCYVRSDDANYISMIGRFVGVRGDLASDPQLSLKVISATDLTVVEPARVNKGITAQLTPPSLTSANASNATQSASTGETN